MVRSFFSIVLSIFVTSTAFAQMDSLRSRIEKLISTKKATVGVAVYGFETGDTLSIANNRHFPLQSVFKFHIALAVLNEVDKGNLSLTQKVSVRKSDLVPNTWSPIREAYPAGSSALSLADILKYTVSQSDNIGCDILLRLIGGANTVDGYVHRIGIKEVAIQANEEAMHKEWGVQFTNWTTPMAAVDLLKKFYAGRILSKSSYNYLWMIMTETSSGKNRIKGQLPAGTPVAHKTGTSDTNEQGVTAAINDIGIITLPNGQHIALSIFVSNSTENTEVNEKIISSIARLAWDHFTNTTK